MLKLTIKHYVFLFFILFNFSSPTIIKAVNSPILTSPSDNEILSKSPKLTWDFIGECVDSGSCFVIEIDNNSDFNSKEKSSYTDKNSYSPQGLADGDWYWRVKAKNKSETWSDWSNTHKFSISENTPSPSLTPSPSASQSPQLVPAEKPPAKKSENIFEINTNVAEINSDEEMEISVKLITEDANKIFYIKGAFKKADSSNYFGFTNFDDTWIVNSAKYLNQFKTFTNASGEWTGKLKVKPDPEDAGFAGSGEYVLKAGKYTESGSGPTWSNELRIKINEVEVPENDHSLEKEATEEAEVDETEDEIDLDYEVNKIDPDSIKIASVAGIAEIRDNTSLEPTETVALEEKQVNWSLIIAGIGILIGTGVFVFYRIKAQRQVITRSH